MRLDCVPGAGGENPYDDVVDGLDEFDDVPEINVIKVEKNPLMLYLEVMKDYILA